MSTAAHAVRRPRHDAADRPFIVIWESTPACLLACPHRRAQAVPERDPLELDTAAASDLSGQVAAFGQPAGFPRGAGAGGPHPGTSARTVRPAGVRAPRPPRLAPHCVPYVP